MEGGYVGPNMIGRFPGKASYILGDLTVDISPDPIRVYCEQKDPFEFHFFLSWYDREDKEGETFLTETVFKGRCLAGKGGKYIFKFPLTGKTRVLN